MSYIRAQGDIVIMDFAPTKGHEQTGRRPALIVSNSFFHQYTSVTLVCPITSTARSFPTHVSLDSRTKTQGEVLCEQIRSVDLAGRNARYVEKIPPDLLAQITNMIGIFIQ